MDHNLGAITVSRKTGEENFRAKGILLGNKLFDFWQWANSDLSSNAIRGILAEYIVASELGLSANLRREWDTYDLLTKDGVKLEIKSAAYLQTWAQVKFSKISFAIGPKKDQDANAKEYSREAKRHADIYIFCLLRHQEKSTLDPLDLDQWTFYILPTSILDAKNEKQKKITLSALLKLNPIQVSFGEISSAIKKIRPASQ
ncbi:MAG: hypothetical protein IT310_10705 [Anaerolineales bacterium]|nr:hypothetical protein [Anaerolineales bacterium]